jgi:gliding motility-associated protein GldM
MNEKFESANASSKETNQQMLAALDAKASEAGGEFAVAAVTAHKVQSATKKFNDFVQTLKDEVLVGVENEDGKLPYEAMDKADNLNNSWFTGEGYTARGKEVISAIENYKKEISSALSDKKYQPILKEINSKFDLSEVANKEGLKIKYLDYHFKGFPAIASLAKLSAWQNDANKAESDVISVALGKAAVETSSMKNYTAMVVLEKNAYFQGEQVKGKVVLGRYDENTVPTSFQGPGKIENGQAVIAATAGSVGEQKIAGKFTFMEDGKEVPLPFEGTYVVRGLPNPMTISFAGISDNNVNASAPGLTKAGTNGKYNLNPGAGTEVTVSVTGKMPDGKAVSDKKVFRIKNIPPPMGAIGGTTVSTKGAKSRLEVSQVSAVLEDFLYDLNFTVTQFTFKVPGQPAIIVNGNRVNEQCRAALARAGRGDQVIISDIRSRIEGANITTKPAAPVVYEIQ